MRYRAQRAHSSSCVPLSTTWPLSTTTMRSASASVERRCAISNVVRPHEHPAQRRVDLLLDPRVDRRGRVVEQQDLGIGEQRPRERDPLALPAREREALLADDGVVAVRQAA